MNVGRVVTTDELSEVAGIRDYQRRIRELRNEEGMRILSHNDRDDLKPTENLLESLERRPVIARAIGDKLRRQILDRNGYTCQVCGAGAGEDSGCEPGKKCRLEIDHVIPISQGGTDDEHNLRAVCHAYNKDKANLKVPTSRDAISAMALIRRQPRNVQLEVYEFLAKKFGSKSDRK
ncbi:MAG TPA: HNH endonuclease [Phycisphaerales bacterium]|nr:HNH endonuclease [Phycisphaerales bacterium]